MPTFVTLVTTATRLRTVVVWGAVSGATAGVGLLLGPALLAGPGRTFVDVLTWGCAGVGLVAAAVAWGVVTDVAGRVLVGAVPRRRVGSVRMLVLLACGVAALSAPGSPAVAHSPADPEAPLSGLPLPDRPDTGAAGTASFTRTATTQAPHATVVVRRGDHLWGIAREQLGPEASDATVARHVHALHRRNAAVIGRDPDLILPGQHLELPPPPGRDHS